MDSQIVLNYDLILLMITAGPQNSQLVLIIIYIGEPTFPRFKFFFYIEMRISGANKIGEPKA